MFLRMVGEYEPRTILIHNHLITSLYIMYRTDAYCSLLPEHDLYTYYQILCFTAAVVSCKMTENGAENSMGIRACIKARSLLGLMPVDIHREVCDIYGEGQMFHRSVCRWVAKFKAGQEDTTQSNVTKIIDLLNKDARNTVKDLARMANITLARVHGILRKHLKLRKNKCKMDTTFVNR